MLIIESFTIGVHNVVIGYPITVLLMLYCIFITDFLLLYIMEESLEILFIILTIAYWVWMLRRIRR